MLVVLLPLLARYSVPLLVSLISSTYARFEVVAKVIVTLPSAFVRWTVQSVQSLVGVNGVTLAVAPSTVTFNLPASLPYCFR